MSGPSSPKATPKRKRDDVIAEHMLSGLSAAKVLTAPVFTFEPPSSSQADDGSSSPRTRVANKFRDLSLERSGGGVRASSPSPDGFASTEPSSAAEVPRQYATESAVFEFDASKGADGNIQDMQVDQDESDALRKRLKHDDQTPESAAIAGGEVCTKATNPVLVDDHSKLPLDKAVDPSMISVAARSLSLGGLKKSYPSINRLADSKSRSRKRAGTPPARKVTELVGEADTVVVDPVRAALTWHEDEITVYDSEDKDDDGTGLNGIGFRPTPAIAYQRAQKRKKQLSEYKKREESEARARRNAKRREVLGVESEGQRRPSGARVRFSDAGPETLEMS
ncbi:hypothetical protein KJ359_008494 [Pestalotiopsis sp. 9143b]|nr:hypothetical protein KJ359_008494 [Pestalotiopsis sp. 9143b]